MQQKTKYQKKCRLKKGDKVMIIAGKSLGETGVIDTINLKKDRIVVGGLNIAKRHTKPGQGNEEGGIVDKVMPVHISNVSLVDPKTNKPTRIGYKDQDGKKVRFAKASGTILD